MSVCVCVCGGLGANLSYSAEGIFSLSSLSLSPVNKANSLHNFYIFFKRRVKIKLLSSIKLL